MASTRAQQAQALKSQSVLDQLTGCLLAAASNVLNESVNTTDHQNRIAYANAILMNPTQQAQFMLPGIMTNPTLLGQAGDPAGASGTPFTDADMDFVVSSLYSKYADQYAAQSTVGAVLKLGT